MNCSGLSQTTQALDKGHSRQSHQVQKAAYFSIKIGYLSWKMEVGCPIQSRGNLEYSTLQPNMAEATVVLHVA